MELPRAILFDADGTLYDSEQLQYEATRLAAKELHGFDFPEEFYITHMRRGAKMGHELLAELGLPTAEADYQEAKMRHFQKLVQGRLQPMPGVRDFLRWCRTEQIKTAVVSSARRAQLATALATTDITGYFDVIVSHEETRGRKKPDPFPYLKALELLGVRASEAIAVEDTDKGLVSAATAGLRCIAIRNATNDESMLARADLIIDNYAELKAYLQE